MNNVVYLIDFSSGHYYVGSTNNAERRKSEHLNELMIGKHGNKYMQSVCNLHGTPQFTVIAQCSDRESAYNVEQLLLNKHFDNEKCLNLCKKAGGPDEAIIARMSASHKGKKLSDETRAKMSATHKGKKKSPFSHEHRAKLSAAAKSRKHSDETRAKMSAVQKGRKQPPCSDEWREKQRTAQKGKKRPPRSAEHSAKISAAQKLRNERERAAKLANDIVTVSDSPDSN